MMLPFCQLYGPRRGASSSNSNWKTKNPPVPLCEIGPCCDQSFCKVEQKENEEKTKNLLKQTCWIYLYSHMPQNHFLLYLFMSIIILYTVWLWFVYWRDYLGCFLLFYVKRVYQHTPKMHQKGIFFISSKKKKTLNVIFPTNFQACNLVDFKAISAKIQTQNSWKIKKTSSITMCNLQNISKCKQLELKISQRMQYKIKTLDI